jgi:hypothetical protein
MPNFVTIYDKVWEKINLFFNEVFSDVTSENHKKVQYVEK